MEIGETRKTEGRLKHLEHIYVGGSLQESAIHIRESDGSSLRQEFYGYIPLSLLGAEVMLYQHRDNKGLLQKLTVCGSKTMFPEEQEYYQILATKEI